MKKLIAIILVLASIMCILCGCGGSDDANDNAIENKSAKTVFFPTLNESKAFVEDEFPQYKDSIVCLESLENVVLQKNGILVGIYYEDGNFSKITSKNSDFSSAFEVLSNYFNTFTSMVITQEELQENMKESMRMPKYTSYKYEDENFEYVITDGEDYVQIQMISKTGKIIVKNNKKENVSYKDKTDKNSNSAIVGKWEYKFALSKKTAEEITLSSYISDIQFKTDGSGVLTFYPLEVYDMKWQLHKSDDKSDTYKLVVEDMEIYAEKLKNTNTDYGEVLAIQTEEFVAYYQRSTSVSAVTSDTSEAVNSLEESISDCSKGHSWKEITKRIHHKEEGHYEQGIVDYNYITIYICPQCSQEFYYYDQYEIHFDTHIAADNNIRFLKDSYKTRSESEPIYGDVWVVDKEAYYEEEVERYECSKCGEIKY